MSDPTDDEMTEGGPDCSGDRSSSKAPRSIDRRALLGAMTGTGVAGSVLSTASPETWQLGDVDDGAQTADPLVVQFDGGGHMHGIDATTGERRWRTEEVRIPASSSPIVVDGMAYVGAADTLYAIETATGEVQWSYDGVDPASASPTVVDGTVFMPGRDAVHAVTAETGDRAWRTSVDRLQSFSGQVARVSVPSPSVVDGQVILSTLTREADADQSVLHALSAETGAPEWSFSNPVPEAQSLAQQRRPPTVASSPTVFDGTAYVAYRGPATDAETSGLYAVDTRTGEQSWALADPEPEPRTSPTVGAGLLFVTTGERDLLAVDPTTGQQQWQTSLVTDDEMQTRPGSQSDHITWYTSEPDPAGRVSTQVTPLIKPSPTVADGTVYAGGIWGGVTAIDAMSGERQWSRPDLGDGMVATPTAHDGDLYVTTTEGMLYALDARSGETQWRYDRLDDPTYSSPTVVAEPQSGSSVGSRVSLGTLGHHGEWASRAAGDDEQSNDADGFDPAIHGFGFPNWTGECGCKTPKAKMDCQSCSESERFTLEFESIDRETVLESVRDWDYNLKAAQAELISRLVHQGLARLTASAGHCYGMVFAAQEYYRDPAALPEGVDTASEVPRPTGEFEPVGERIRTYHTSQQVSAATKWQALWGVIFDQVDLSAALEQILTTLDRQDTVSVALGRFEAPIYTGHQVLAYDYEVRSDEGLVDIYCYDPNFAADSAEYPLDGRARRPLVADMETGSLEQPYATLGGTIYDRYAPLDPSISLTGAEILVESEDSLFDRFSNGVSFALNSPASLEVQAPGDATVIEMTSEFAYEAPMADGRVVLDADPEECTVSVVGEGSGEYTLDVYGIRDASEVLRTQVTGTIENGQTERYRVTPNGDDEETGPLTLASEEVNDDGDADQSLPGLGLLSGAAGLGGGAYWLSRQNGEPSDDDE